MSMLWPLMPLGAIYLFTQTGIQTVLAIPLGMSYIVVPLLDWLVGSAGNRLGEPAGYCLDHTCLCRNHGHIGDLCFDAICLVAAAACESDGLHVSHAQLGLGLGDRAGSHGAAGSDLIWCCLECCGACHFA